MNNEQIMLSMLILMGLFVIYVWVDALFLKERRKRMSERETIEFLLEVIATILDDEGLAHINEEHFKPLDEMAERLNIPLSFRYWNKKMYPKVKESRDFDYPEGNISF